MNLIGKNVVVYGAGVSGLSAYELVRERGGKAIIYDDNKKALHATNSVGIFESADIIVLSPGVANDKDFLLDAKLENKIVISELELASECCIAEQIAITGTNGKTTTTMLINHIFNCAHRLSHAVGNIGVAFSAIADKLDATEIAIIEASSFQLESAINFAPDTAVLLNIKPDHLERHGTMQKYINAKANIFLKQSKSDYVVFNEDDENICQLVPLMVAQKIPFSLTHPVDGAYISSGFICYKGTPVMSLDDIDMKGRELENALAATAVCISHGVSPFCVATALSTFERPEFRRKVSASIDGIKIFNDSKSTNVYACLSAIESIDANCILMLGGAIRCENFDDLFCKLDKKIKAIVVVGENARIICDCAAKNGFANIVVSRNLREGVLSALKIAKTENVKNVLFSPASKSFDNFSSYIERGRVFDATVAKIKNDILRLTDK